MDITVAWLRAHSIKTLMSADGKARVFILARDDGLYMFAAESQREDEDEGFTYWVPTHDSGIFDNAETAEREAIACVPWLKQQLGLS